MFTNPTKARDYIHEKIGDMDCDRKKACLIELSRAMKYTISAYGHHMLNGRSDMEMENNIKAVMYVMDAMWYANSTFEAAVVSGDGKYDDPLDAYPDIIFLLGDLIQRTSDGQNWEVYSMHLEARSIVNKLDDLIESAGGNMRELVFLAL